MSENVSLQVESRQATVGAVPQATVGAVPQAAEQTVNVPLLVLQNVKNILDICGERGTFKTAEMYGVGLTYNEIVRFTQSADQNGVKSV